MSCVRSKNTKPELLIRSLLHGSGYRFRIHRKDLPGNPDIVLPKYNTIIMVNGCFWHLHGCEFSKIPDTRKEWWAEKLQSNKARDERNLKELLHLGWRVINLWQCSFRKTRKNTFDNKMSEIKSHIENFLFSDRSYMEIDANGVIFPHINSRDIK